MRLRTSLLTFLAAAALLAPTAGRAQTPAVERMGVYVLAQDMDRAATFYEKLFGRPAQFRTPDLIGFDVAGGLYAVASRKTYAPDAVRGGNVAPYLKVADVDAWFARVRAMAPASLVTPAVVREGPFSLIKFSDP